jgi:hypothetical protein
VWLRIRDPTSPRRHDRQAPESSKLRLSSPHATTWTSRVADDAVPSCEPFLHRLTDCAGCLTVPFQRCASLCVPPGLTEPFQSARRAPMTGDSGAATG